MLFWEDMIALISMLEVLLFLCQYELLSWIFRIWIFIPQLRRITLKIMPSSTPHQKFCFYHLPTRGRAGIKLGDAWYVSNVSIIFIVPFYYIIHLGCFICIYMLFYMIFGTNLLTQSLVPVSIFPCFWVSQKRKTKWSPIDLKLHGTHFWKERSPEDLECT